jgi:Cu+-exporting ATPase
VTGDRERAAQAVGRRVGVDRVVAGVTPIGKAREVRRLQEEGRRVAMVGDGVNDAPALVQADLGVAAGGSSAVTAGAAAVALVHEDLLRVPEALLLCRATLATIRRNLFWAFAYNALAIPVAALGLLDPMIAAGAMALSSVSVVASSLRLRGWQARGPA